MASAFSHALLALTIGKSIPEKQSVTKFLLLGSLCAVLPDADVLTFKFGIHYDDFLGHRGFFHSLLFSLVLGVLATFAFYRNQKFLSLNALKYILFFFLCAASHGLLDMMTNGGHGVAIFSPFDNTRYFLPWRPIQVSPIGVNNFFSEWGIKVLLSELFWIGIPCFVYFILFRILQKNKGA